MGHRQHLPLTIAILLMGTLSAAPTFAREAKRHHTANAAAATPTSQEARHKDCLAFIQRHGLSCDPWKEPTCGYDLGIARPLTCVAP